MPIKKNKGGRRSDGSPSFSDNPAKNAGHALSKEVRDAIASLPAVKSGEWTKSYLAEQLWRNYLGLSHDFNWEDLEIIAKGEIVDSPTSP